ncbi:MAG: hypothetical protein KME20_00025 [Kaiparowitsia implicata GSE-PSE-MK54-09C]|jgi:hypothetical protein|nr:hypothetical protein [Kaiparowitsia implicata GSE-PSE-MK54-09C]
MFQSQSVEETVQDMYALKPSNPNGVSALPNGLTAEILSDKVQLEALLREISPNKRSVIEILLNTWEATPKVHLAKRAG